MLCDAFIIVLNDQSLTFPLLHSLYWYLLGRQIFPKLTSSSFGKFSPLVFTIVMGCPEGVSDLMCQQSAHVEVELLLLQPHLHHDWSVSELLATSSQNKKELFFCCESNSMASQLVTRWKDSKSVTLLRYKAIMFSIDKH